MQAQVASTSGKQCYFFVVYIFFYAIEKEFTFDFILFSNWNANYIWSLEEFSNKMACKDMINQIMQY